MSELYHCVWKRKETTVRVYSSKNNTVPNLTLPISTKFGQKVNHKIILEITEVIDSSQGYLETYKLINFLTSFFLWIQLKLVHFNFLYPDVLTFCVSSDCLDGCCEVTFVTWILGFAVCWFNVVSEITFFGCCVVAFITWVGHFSVDWLNVFSEMIFFNCGEITFIIVSFSKLWFITKSLGENDNRTIAILWKYEHKSGLFIKDFKDIVYRHSN